MKVGDLVRLTHPALLGGQSLPEGTLLLFMGAVRVGRLNAIDYHIMINGVMERVPDYWGGWPRSEVINASR